MFMHVCILNSACNHNEVKMHSLKFSKTPALHNTYRKKIENHNTLQITITREEPIRKEPAAIQIKLQDKLKTAGKLYKQQ